ncbi:Fic family protein [Jatrophihabitans sp.]|uniref:Fic family protein n=1 Tax=Jatrophihabitans sp. TaxID=1932789 RepID=UPI0038CD3F4B
MPAAIVDLETFLSRNDLPPLIHAAIAHAQFETIHPFSDGNGRTGRALVHSILRAKGLTRQVTVPVSAGLLADTNSYFAALTAYREGDPEPIVERLSNATFAAVNNGRTLVAELHAVRD